MALWGKPLVELLNLFQPSRVPTGKPQRVSRSPDWKLAWGNLAAIAEPPIWQDGRVAVLLDSAQNVLPSELPLAISPSGRFVVIGDAWLYEREMLLQGIGIAQRDWYGSDLQMISQLWEHWSKQDQDDRSIWHRLIGMFAFAVWDCDRQTLAVGRDRAGTFPLYTTSMGAVQWIAPKLRSLLPHHSGSVDTIALRDYLCCAFVPGERTMWQNVREVRPGTVLHLPQGTVKPYWTLQEQIVGAAEPIEWHSNRLRSLLEQTVKDALPVSNPVGCFLSGGVDSSCVAALARRFHAAPVHTFSIHFGTDYPNELEFSGLVAQHCQTEHHILEISLRDLWRYLPEAMTYLDDPIGDPLTVPNLLLGRLAKQFVSVVLNGEGGDPCFGGPKNQPMLIHSLYGEVSQQDAIQAYLISFQKCAADLPQLLKPEVWATVRDVPYPFEPLLNAEMNYLNRLMAINIQFKGADHILTKVNNLTRAVGLEGRSPLFDQRIVELSMQIPPQHKLSGVQEKAVLKHAIADLLPDAIVNRPKSGMMVPVQIGFQKQWQHEARSLLLSRRAAIAPYLNQSLIRDWLDFRGDTWRRYGVKLWLLASLEIWLQVNQKLR